jgi:flagellar biosynthesis protein FlhG
MIVDQAEKLRNMVREKIAERVNNLKAHVITIASGKGGSGKSNIALNLGIILSRMNRKVLLYDADLNLANIDVLLGMSPKYRILDLIRGDVKLNDVIIEVRNNLKLLPANSGSINFPEISGESLIKIISDFIDVESDFDFILVDAPAGISDEVIKLVSFSHDYILVVTPEPTAIMDAYAVIKLVNYKSGRSNVKVIVNNSGLEKAIEVVERLSVAAWKFLNVKVDFIGSIPYDPMVQKAVMFQKPFVELYPRTSASIALRKIADKLLALSRIKKQNSFFRQVIDL